MSKSYGELERKLSSMMPGPQAPDFDQAVRKALGVPEAPDAYRIALKDDLLQIDPEVKSRILEGVIIVMSFKDPNSALQLARSLPPGNSLNISIKNSLNLMAQSDPRAAIGLASGLPNADLRSKAQQNVVEVWKLRDPDAATQWINSSSLPQDVKVSLLREE
jgi:hypothetical protein